MKYLILVFVLFTLLIQITYANDNTHGFYINPAAYYSYGYIDYTINLPGADTSFRSELEFPLRSFNSGVEFGYYLNNGDRPNWEFYTALYRHMSNTDEPMKDHDWFSENEEIYQKFSYTESDIMIKNTVVNFGIRKNLLSIGDGNLNITAGYRYQEVRQRIFGIRGWQININDANPTRIDINEGGEFLYYLMQYKSPFIGFEIRQDILNRFKINFLINYLRVFSSDYDDHLARNKILTAEGSGHGLRSEFDIGLNLSNSDAVRKFHLGIIGSLFIAEISTDQSQRWYGDDPISPQDDTGTVIDGIDYKTKTLQYGIGLRLIIFP
jgi:hypothetical protein